MSETPYTFRPAVVEEAPLLAAAIARLRQDAYGLDESSFGYAHMVEEIRSPRAVQEIAATIEAFPRRGFAVVVDTPDTERVAFALGHTDRRHEVIDYLFVEPTARQHNLARVLTSVHQRMSRKPELAWVLKTNPVGVAFWERVGFAPVSEYTDASINLTFLRMERKKQLRRKVA